MRQNDDVALYSQRAFKDKLPLLEVVRGSVGVGLVDADAGLAAFGHGSGQMHPDELRVLFGFRRHQASGLGILSADHLELKLFARGALDNSLLRCRGPRTDGIEEVLSARTHFSHVIGDGELVRLRR